MRTEPTEPRQPLGRCAGALGLVCGVFFVNLSSRAILAPLLPAMERDLGIGHGAATSLFLLVSLGYCTGLLTSGFVNARLTHRTTIALSSVLLGGTALALAASHGLIGLSLGTFALGAVAGLYLSSGIATVTALVEPRDWGKALAVHELAPNLALTVVPLAAEALLVVTSWRGVLAACGAAALAAGAAFGWFGRGGRFRGEPPTFRIGWSLARTPRFWVLLLLFGLGLAGTVGLFSVLPLYLTAELGLTRPRANALVALSRAAGLATVLASGWLSDRLGPARAMAAVLTATGVATLALSSATPGWVAAGVVLQSVPGAWFFPPAFAALSAVSPLAVSFAVPFAMVLGGGAVPALVGFLGERGHFRAAVGLVGGLLVLGGVAASRLRDRRA